jgi:energy-coupling factor transporter ATP-binding protein EcfA2
MISIEELCFRFRDSELDALNNVSLTIESGEFVVVTGPSGCGKSTLALAIGGYLFRQFDGDATGTVNVNGIDVRERPIYDLAEIVGLVQQNPEAQFCTLTVQDEVAFGLENRCLARAEIRERMAWALGIVGAEHLVGRELATLSGGEKQKVAIAAMMAAKPEVLIFDEPTSNLDPAATADIFAVIQHIRDKAGITVLVIEHKLGYLLPFEPRLVTMDAGRIVYDGPMAEARLEEPHLERNRESRSFPQACAIPIVCVEGLRAGYNGHSVLQDVSLEVHAGEFIAIMGENGSGKSTFLRCLLGLLKPQQGRVMTAGRDTRTVPVSHLARQVGFVFQNPDHQLFADSVWGEATFAPANFGLLDAETAQHVRESLDSSGLGERLDDHPYRLSYGQKRRLNLVSILAYAPSLILLDEVLIGQDPKNAAFLLELLEKRAAAGAAVVMVNHAPRVAQHYASRLVFFDRGKVTVDGHPKEAFARLEATGMEVFVPPPEVQR